MHNGRSQKRSCQDEQIKGIERAHRRKQTIEQKNRASLDLHGFNQYDACRIPTLLELNPIGLYLLLVQQVLYVYCQCHSYCILNCILQINAIRYELNDKPKPF